MKKLFFITRILYFIMGRVWHSEKSSLLHINVSVSLSVMFDVVVLKVELPDNRLKCTWEMLLTLDYLLNS